MSSRLPRTFNSLFLILALGASACSATGGLRPLYENHRRQQAASAIAGHLANRIEDQERKAALGLLPAARKDFMAENFFRV